MRPVYRAVNKRPLIFGVGRETFMIAVVLFAVVFELSSRLTIALAVSVILMTAGKFLTRSDEGLLAVWLHSVKMGRLYDSSLQGHD